MKSPEKKYARVADFQPGDVDRAIAIVAQTLGQRACFEAGFYPKNIGIKGDEGVLGETVAIVPTTVDIVSFLKENTEGIEVAVQRLTGEIDAITKVLIITHETGTV